MKDNRWTKHCADWQPGRGKRSRGQLTRRWQDDIAKERGTTLNRKATDRGQWKALVEGYKLQWVYKAQVKGERDHIAFNFSMPSGPYIRSNNYQRTRILR